MNLAPNTEADPAGVPPDLAEWHARFVGALVARDAAAYAAFLAPDCVVQINNALPVYSRDAMEHSHNAYLQLFETLTVDVLALHGAAHDFSAEVMLNYTLADGSPEFVQCAYFITRRSDGLIATIRLYGNASRVFKPFIRLM